MKAIWNDAFFDMDCGLSREEFAEKMSESIHADLDNIYWAIKDYDLKEAMLLIDNMKVEY